MTDEAAEPELRTLPPGYLTRFNADHEHLFIVTQIFRPGVDEACQAIEYQLFPPGSELNRRFQLYLTTWEEIRWVVLQMPLVAKPDVVKVLDRIGWRLQDGIPQIMAKEGEPYDWEVDKFRFRRFPLHSDNTFGLMQKAPAGPVATAYIGPLGPQADSRVSEAAARARPRWPHN
jgi:hypothetical protein